MSETYCGKICAECTQKEALNCPGCRPGPGRQFGGDCELAKCCRDKGHEVCETCGFKGNCNTLRGRESMPDYRRRKQEAEAQHRAAVAQRAPVLGKWLWILFWLIIPNSIAGLLTNDTVVSIAPALQLPGSILQAACSLTYGAILLKLAVYEGRYRTAGICALAAGASSVLTAILTGTGSTPTWTLVYSAPVAIAALVGEYNEYMAHSSILTGVDNDLSDKWHKLWGWYILFMVALILSLLLTMIIPILGILVMLACAIGILVTGILKLVYLYRTAKLFREYPV